jgi:hypothetical protein
MGILVTFLSGKARPRGRSAATSRSARAHIGQHGLVTDRAVTQGEGADRSLIEMFEWSSEEKSRMAPTIAEVAGLWKSMSEAMDFVALSSLAEAQRPFAHFKPI